MKIAMFTNTYIPHVGGVARSVASFTDDLKKMGHSLLVVAPEYSKGNALQEDEEKTLRVPAIQNFNASDFSLRIPVPFLIDNRMDAFQPDIIHSHHPYLLGDAALRAARRRNLPLIFTHHTLYEEYTHYVSPDTEEMKQFAAHLSTEYANLCTRVVAPSRSIKELIESRGVITPVIEIPTGVDTQFFRRGDGNRFRKRHKIPAEAFLIGHVGRLAPEKNLEYLADAVADALKSLPSAGFLVVGEGPSLEKVTEILEQAGVGGRLIKAGKQTGAALADAYCAMDLFVFASCSETQGMVLTEAMAAGLPVIALDAPGAREVVGDLQNGRLLQADASAPAFAEAVILLAQDKAKIQRMSRAAKETAGGFERQVCARKLEALYREAAAVQTPAMQQPDYPESWEKLLLSIKTECELISEKTRAALKTIRE